MKTLLFFCLLGLALSQPMVIPDAAMIRKLVDSAFDRLDHSPKDGEITQAEWDVIISADDVDKNNCVTEVEFASAAHLHNAQLGIQMFNHFDHDNDGCMHINDMSEEFKLMDTTGDDLVSLQEFERHMVGVVSKIFGRVFPMTIGGVAG